MSIEALQWAFDLPVKGANKAVLVTLADHANKSGKCWPSVGRLARRAGVSDRAVRSALRYLETMRLIETSRVNGGRSNYLLHVGTRLTDGVSPSVVNPDEDFRPTPEATSVLPGSSIRQTLKTTTITTTTKPLPC